MRFGFLGGGKYLMIINGHNWLLVMLAQQVKAPSPGGTSLERSEEHSPFKIVRNHRRNPTAASPHHNQDDISPADSASQIGSTRKPPSPNDPQRRRKIRKQRRGKKYSEESQNKRDIRLRYADPSEDSEEALARQMALWSNLWLPEVKAFARMGDNRLAEIFKVELQPQQPPLTPVAVQEHRQMPHPLQSQAVPKQRNVIFERSAEVIRERNEMEVDLFDFMPLRFRYQDSYNRNEDSNDFFFDPHHLNQ